ncbi:MAG: ComF family protein [Treponema sp.]|nr:ComF family protein [Treponema sp.]
MNILTSIFLTVRNFLFPGVCVLCNETLLKPDEVKFGLCKNCSNIEYNSLNGTCKICGKPLISEIETCLSCRNEKRIYDSLWTLFPYTGRYRKLLAFYKFGKTPALADFFAEKITKIIEENPQLKDAEIVPVPPRKGKIKETGWDQVEYLVKRLANYKINRCLRRKKSKVQKNLNRKERLENLKGRIYCEGSAPKTALIIDDIITTGSTMEVCADVLKSAGAERVYGLCLFFD